MIDFFTTMLDFIPESFSIEGISQDKQALTLDNKKVEYFSSLVFGICGGLLSLIGLIAIFISLNTQHNIAKAKEVLITLDMFDLDNAFDFDKLNEINDDSKAKKFITNQSEYRERKLKTILLQYKNLTKLSLSSIIVSVLVFVTMVFVVSFWLILYKVYSDFNITPTGNLAFWFVNIASLLVVLFAILILLLSFSNIFGGIPSLKGLLNGSKVRYHNLSWFASTLSVEVERGEKRDITFKIVSIFPYNNIVIVPHITIDSTPIIIEDIKIVNTNNRLKEKDFIERNYTIPANDIFIYDFNVDGIIQMNLDIYNKDKSKYVNVSVPPLTIEQLKNRKYHILRSLSLSQEFNVDNKNT